MTAVSRMNPTEETRMTTTPTPALPLLDELDELRAKATAGPWRVVATGGTDLFTGESYREVEVEFADPIENAGLILGEHELAETDAALIVAAVNRLPQLTAALRAAEDALRLISRNGCETTTGNWSCLDPGSGRTRLSPYGADRWCDSCVAADALAAITTALEAS